MGYNPVLAFFLFTGMTEERRTQLVEEYNAAMERPRRVYEIFCDYFGEDKVDMQGFRTLEQYILNGGGPRYFCLCGFLKSLSPMRMTGL